jgi:hypothetical protein
LSRRTGDPLLANGPGERRGAARLSVEQPARLRVADLTLEGTIRDVATGGVFLATQLLIEVGERGELIVGDTVVAVQVVWLRGNAHPSGPGMGLAFVDDDAATARLLALLGA